MSATIQKWTAIVSFLMGVGLVGCSSTSVIMEDASDGKPTPVDYTVVYYIHGDADYLYHDSEGNPVRNNSKVLETAMEVAEEAVSGQVFIFYQRSERTFLRLYSRRKSQFYHFINGEKKRQVAYRHAHDEYSFLEMEADLYQKYRVQESDTGGAQYFFYYGHEIPSQETGGYHRSLPKVQVNPVSLAQGLHRLRASSGTKFDLSVISTCNNATPGMVHNLLPYTRYLLASPQNLHLSHIDSDPLKLLESRPRIPSQKLADTLAGRTYQRLQHKLQTTVSLSLFNLKVVDAYLDDLYKSASRRGRDPVSSESTADNIDCAKLPFFDAEKYTRGVKVWFKSAEFGRNTNQQDHSGWGCRPISNTE